MKFRYEGVEGSENTISDLFIWELHCKRLIFRENEVLKMMIVGVS